MCNKEDIEMASEIIYRPFSLNEEACKKMISSSRTKIKESNVFNDLNLNKSERIAHAARILNSRKCK